MKLNQDQLGTVFYSVWITLVLIFSELPVAVGIGSQSKPIWDEDSTALRNRPNGKIDVVIDTDLGGDPDDIQSLVRLLHYSDIFNIKGIISTPCTDIADHPWDTIPQVSLIREWIMRVDLDHLRANGYEDLMAEQDLLGKVYSGSQQPQLPAPGKKNEGSESIIKIAKGHSTGNPLWILVWGSMTTLAQAIHDDPSIASGIRIYSIGTTNTLHDSLSRNFIYRFMETQYSELWWIENGILPKWSHETMRGVYLGGEQSEEWGNAEFVIQNIRGKGTYGQGRFTERLGDAFPVATSPKGILKEGDSPTLLYLMSPIIGGVGDINDPTGESWGGQFRKANPERFPNYFVDLDLSPGECQATINKWRVDFLKDWKKRWERYRTDHPASFSN